MSTPPESEIDDILVLFSKRLAIVQGEYNASMRLSEVQKHAEEAQEDARAALSRLIAAEVLNEFQLLPGWANGCQCAVCKVVDGRIKHLKAELEAGSGEAT